MQVFMPLPDYLWSHQNTDSVRLNRGITEAYQLLGSTLKLAGGYPHHPARVQFADRLGSLVRYVEIGQEVLAQRPGYGAVHLGAAKCAATYLIWCDLVGAPPITLTSTVMADPFAAMIKRGVSTSRSGPSVDAALKIPPFWSPDPASAAWSSEISPGGLGHPAFHLGHQFNLCRKRPDIYTDLFDLRATSTVKVPATGRLETLTYGEPQAPPVSADDEPYLWPLPTAEGETVFQVGTRTCRRRYAHLFDVDPTPRTPLLITPAQALERTERDHPDALAGYLKRVEAWKADPSVEEARAAKNAGWLRQRTLLLPGQEPAAAPTPEPHFA